VLISSDIGFYRTTVQRLALLVNVNDKIRQKLLQIFFVNLKQVCNDFGWLSGNTSHHIKFRSVLFHEKASKTLGIFASRTGYTHDAMEHFESRMRGAAALAVIDDEARLRMLALNAAARRLLPLLVVGTSFVQTPLYSDVTRADRRRRVAGEQSARFLARKRVCHLL
jgi:hypothetical protein